MEEARAAFLSHDNARAFSSPLPPQRNLNRRRDRHGDCDNAARVQARLSENFQIKVQVFQPRPGATARN